MTVRVTRFLPIEAELYTGDNKMEILDFIKSKDLFVNTFVGRREILPGEFVIKLCAGEEIFAIMERDQFNKQYGKDLDGF